jgi:hypothetical protein
MLLFKILFFTALFVVVREIEHVLGAKHVKMGKHPVYRFIGFLFSRIF